uniref:Uncharacterized protein n=1 Tax=uncultured marine virus TaxID=186617 RepID=A0A0F7LB96_9VIRU|nr:hypothetical protein [uncultured marine virus]
MNPIWSSSPWNIFLSFSRADLKSTGLNALHRSIGAAKSLMSSLEARKEVDLYKRNPKPSEFKRANEGPDDVVVGTLPEK